MGHAGRAFQDIIGLDDGYFPHPKQGGRTILAGVALDAELTPRSTALTWVTVDGTDATEKAAEVVNRLLGDTVDPGTPLPVLLDGVTYAGFNYVDPWALEEALGARARVVVYFRWLPDAGRVREALEKHFPDHRVRWSVISGVIRGAQSLIVGGMRVHAFAPSMGWDEVVGLIVNSCIRGAQPEPLRLAHMVASGVARALGSGGPGGPTLGRS